LDAASTVPRSRWHMAVTMQSRASRHLDETCTAEKLVDISPSYTCTGSHCRSAMWAIEAMKEAIADSWVLWGLHTLAGDYGYRTFFLMGALVFGRAVCRQ
jgi:hypothetical protein